MAKNKNVKVTEENLENVESALSNSEQFIEKNQKMLTIVIAALVVVVGGYLSYQKFYKVPLEKEAQAQMFIAERYFERDSFNLALNGDVNYPGFIGVIEDYSSTSTANLANYYAGICYYRLNDFDNAIEYLQNFNSSDIMLSPIAKGLLGDAYSEKNDLDKAVSYYMEAANASTNDFTTPMFLLKAGNTYEMLNDYSNALEVYQEIKDDYNRSQEAALVDKYITRVKLNK